MQVVLELVIELVKQEIASFVRNYLFEQSQIHNTHPLDGVVNDIIFESVHDLLTETVKTSVAELVDDYLFFNNFEGYKGDWESTCFCLYDLLLSWFIITIWLLLGFLTETLTPIFFEIATEVSYEVTIEVILEEIREQSINELCAEVNIVCSCAFKDFCIWKYFDKLKSI